jgi:hypothetical protein
VERLLRVAERDPVVAAAFNDVCDLLAPPQQVMSPRILWRVLRGTLRRPQVPPTEPSTATAAAKVTL